MALQFEAIGQVVDDAISDIHFEGRQAVGGGYGQHHGLEEFARQRRLFFVNDDARLTQALVLDEGPQLREGLPDILFDRQVAHELPLQPHRGRTHRARHHHRNLVADFGPALAVSLELPDKVRVGRFQLRAI